MAWSICLTSRAIRALGVGTIGASILVGFVLLLGSVMLDLTAALRVYPVVTVLPTMCGIVLTLTVALVVRK